MVEGGMHVVVCFVVFVCLASLGALGGTARGNGICSQSSLLLSCRPPFFQCAFGLHLAILASSHLWQKHIISAAYAAALWALRGKCMCTPRH